VRAGPLEKLYTSLSPPLAISAAGWKKLRGPSEFWYARSSQWTFEWRASGDRAAVDRAVGSRGGGERGRGQINPVGGMRADAKLL
jgi:hypothetical protein